MGAGTTDATAAQVGQLREALAHLLSSAAHDAGCDAFIRPCRCALRRSVGLAVAALRETGGLPAWLEGYEHGDD